MCNKARIRHKHLLPKTKGCQGQIAVGPGGDPGGGPGEGGGTPAGGQRYHLLAQCLPSSGRARSCCPSQRDTPTGAQVRSAGNIARFHSGASQTVCVALSHMCMIWSSSSTHVSFLSGAFCACETVSIMRTRTVQPQRQGPAKGLCLHY